MSDSQMQSFDPRAELEARLDYVLGLIRRGQQLVVSEQQIHAKYQSWYLGYKKRWGAGMYFLLALAIIVVLYILSPIMQYATALIFGAMGAGSDQAAISIARLVLGLLPLFAGFVLAGVIVALWNKRVLVANARIQDENQRRSVDVAAAMNPELDVVFSQMDQVRVGLRQYAEGWIPRDYFSDEVVGFCLTMARNHRASTLQEALNLYETEQHRMRMENLAQAQLEQQRRTQQAVMLGNFINAVGHAATVSAVRSEGAASRAASATAAASINRNADQNAASVNATIRREANRFRR